MSSSINHIESNYSTTIPLGNSHHHSLSYLENIDRLLNLTKSSYSGIQYTGIRGLGELSNSENFKYLVLVFAKYRSLEPIYKLMISPDEKVRSDVLSLLWQFSAEENLKIKMYEDRIFKYLIELFDLNDESTEMAASAIIQNLSEFRLEKGEINQNQIKIAHYPRILNKIIERSNNNDRRIKFLSCMTLCNLSMNEENRIMFEQKNIFKEIIEKFNLEFINDSEFPSSFNWLTLQPHMPLLASKNEHVQIFVLYCLHSFSLSEKYNRKLWRVLGTNQGIRSLVKLKESKNILVKDFSTKISDILSIDNDTFEWDREESQETMNENIQNLFNNESMFPDIYIKSSSNQNGFYIHRCLCISRCPNLFKLFQIGLNSNSSNNNNNNLFNNIVLKNNNYQDTKQEIELEHDFYQIFYQIFRWIYGFEIEINSETMAKTLLPFARLLDLNEIVETCEYALWHHINLNNCSELLHLSLENNAPQLEKVCIEFILRNIELLYFGDFDSLGNQTYYMDNDIGKLWNGVWTDKTKEYVINKYQIFKQQKKIEIQHINKEAFQSSREASSFRI
ncbi:hypothetical protein CYY_005369 [Polysphondylium violaceum]|uniref:BTB domain-containing protein n=1 Tax=Polysphondylium violaceum TaxID=133409 RepID=A0A8J4Q394_9MYCE|nr:hypothetical protein CYY_005369 [Polysphondylium violaceum]